MFRYLADFASRFGWTPRQVDELTLAEFDHFAATFDRARRDERSAARTARQARRH